MKKYIQLLTFFFAFAILFTSCKKEYDKIENIEAVEIQAYIKKNNLEDVMLPDPEGSGFYYQIVEEGTGDVMKNNAWVLFNYQYKSLKTGETFFTNNKNGNMGNFLGYLAEPSYPTAFRKALVDKPYGTSVRIIIPSYLAFGKNGNESLNIGSNEIVDATVSTYNVNDQKLLDDSKIVSFLTTNSISATKDPSRVYVSSLENGSGTDLIDETSVFKVKYTGKLLDGTVFDSSTDGAFETTIGGVISGWKVLEGKKVGDKIRIFIPSDLGYGNGGSGAIPANAILDFEIEVVEVKN